MKNILALVLLCFASNCYGAVIYLGVGVNSKAKGDDDYAPEITELSGILQPQKKKLILGHDVTVKNVILGLEWLVDTAVDHDLVIVYIAAHGHFDGKYSFSGWKEYIYGSLISNYINQVKGKIVVIVDTCHSGGILREYWRKGIQVYTSCGEDEYSWGRFYCEQLYDKLRRYSIFEVQKHILGDARQSPKSLASGSITVMTSPSTTSHRFQYVFQSE